ncbi:MAG: DUF2911 domain-containing protein [Reichenbachiella sp.]|uniref:DUF2911 domain-containing protein n=1 Tax=Reichenbachiella sp. TaxID=2184521 RepID=UPI0032637E19
MKKNLTISTTTLLIVCLMTTFNINAQQRASPAKVSEATVNGNNITIKYSSPSKKGRDIFGALEPYGKVWRTGANEATTIELSKDATVGGVAVKAGKYALFTIPGEKEWTVIINADAKQWGAFKYDQSKDIGRFTTSPSTLSDTVESFTIDANDSGTVALSWDKTKVEFSIK